MKYYDRCNDCGLSIIEEIRLGRADICDTCWGNRGWLLKNHEKIGMAEFRKIQRAMASQRGTAKKRIEKAKCLLLNS